MLLVIVCPVRLRSFVVLLVRRILIRMFCLCNSDIVTGVPPVS